MTLDDTVSEKARTLAARAFAISISDLLLHFNFFRFAPLAVDLHGLSGGGPDLREGADLDVVRLACLQFLYGDFFLFQRFRFGFFEFSVRGISDLIAGHP